LSMCGGQSVAYVRSSVRFSDPSMAALPEYPAPATIDDEGFADVGAASPFR